MSKPTIYVETSIIGYLAMRSSRDVIVAANQQLAREWWFNHRAEYDVYVSSYVIDECAAGDPAAAVERSVFLKDLPVLDLPEPDVSELSTALAAKVGLPEKARIDILHITAAAVNGIEYLLTLNCKHIANASLQSRMREVCVELGYELPIICTPQEILGIEDVS